MLLVVWCFCAIGCSTTPAAKTVDEVPKLTVDIALDVLNRQLSQPYSIYEYRRRFRSDSERQQFMLAHYIEQLSIDRANRFIQFSHKKEGDFDFVDVASPAYMPPVSVYALNKFGFAYADGKRIIQKVISIDSNIVNFKLVLASGPLLKSRGFTDSTTIDNGRAKLEFNKEKKQYEIIVFEQLSRDKQEWRKLGFEVERNGQKTVFFIDPDTELLFAFLEKYDRKSKKFKAMLSFQKYINPIRTR